MVRLVVPRLSPNQLGHLLVCACCHPCVRRFAPESDHGANAGLAVARKLLEPVKEKYPWISYADLWTLAGATAIEAMGGGQHCC